MAIGGTVGPEDFSLPEGTHYLNCAYMSPQPRVVEKAGLEAVGRKNDPTSIGASDFFDESDRLRALFARLIGAADPGQVALVPAVSYPLAIAGRHLLPPGADLNGRNVVIAAEQFPSNVLIWKRGADRTGAEVRTVARPAQQEGQGRKWNDDLIAAIDRNTLAVAIPNVHWTDGTRFDLERIGERAGEVGAALVVDGTQSIGALPFDLNAVGASLVIAAGYKWLLGPYSTALAWLGGSLAEADPLEETWLGRTGSEDFTRPNYSEQYRPDASRFDSGERSNFVLHPMLARALELVLEITPEAVQRYCDELTHDALAELRTLGYGVAERDQRANHLFGVRPPPSVDPALLSRALSDHGVSVSHRAGAVRISPHLYNTSDDVAALVAAFRDAASPT